MAGKRLRQRFSVLSLFLGLALAVGLAVAGAVVGSRAEHSAAGSPHVQQLPATTPPAVVRTPRRDPAVPVRLQIPRLGLDRPLLKLGLTKDGELQVPEMSQANLPGWYRYSPPPGDVGPAVIAGHVDSMKGPAVFYELRELRKGDTIRVRRDDGVLAVFTVSRIQLFSKAHFPTKLVYGAIRRPALRLITCGGVYDRAHGGYQGNTIVFAKLTRLQHFRA